MKPRHADRTPTLANSKLGWRTVLVASLMLVLCYLVAGLSGLLDLHIPDTPWPLWLGCAVLIAILLASRREMWPILIPAGLAGFLVYDLQGGMSIRSLLWLVLGDIGEILVVLWGVRYFLDGVPRLDSLKAFAKYVLVTVILAPLVACWLGIAALDGNRWINFGVAFLSEGLAFLTVAPAILGCVEHFRTWRQTPRSYYLEAAALITAVISLSYAIFAGRITSTSPALLYSLVPFLLWSALRFGFAGAGTTASIVALLSLWGAVHGRGPFTETEPITRVFSLQLFLMFTAVPFMALAVLAEERKRQEVVLRESEERFRLMADHAPTLIWMSGTDRLRTFFNQGWLRFTGHPMEQELREGWVSGVHPDDLEHCLRISSAAFDSRVDFEIEYRLRRHDGQYRWMVDHGVPRYGPDGAFCGYIGSCSDVTERKLSEISLRNFSGRLIHAQEEERSRIARELHDDISQRMAILQISLEQFKQGALGASVNDREQLHELTEATSELSSDLHNICHQLHPRRLDVLGLVPTVSTLCAEFSHQNGIQVSFLNHDVPTHIPVDVSLCLFRVVQEALWNVLKHAKTSEASVELSTQAGEIHLCISDSGAGFSPNSVQGKGGLGLVSMSERLRLIGGNLTVESEPLHGTQVRARVPLVDGIRPGTNEPKHYKANA
jgi:PAS domain S-box-containing protein